MHSHDLAGRMVEEIDAENHSTRYVYNRADQLIQTLYPDKSEARYSYDRTGRLTERKGFVSDLGIRAPKPPGPVSPSDFTHFRYLEGNLVFAENEDAKITRKYDFLNRLIEEQTNINEGPTHQIFYDYDRDRLIQTLFADQQIRYEYDAAGFLRDMVSQSNHASENRLSDSDLVTFTYDPLGRRQRMVVNGQLVKSYAYDQASRLTELDYTFDKKPVFFEKLTYNAVNNIIRKEEEDGVTEYDYDEIDQLTLAKGPRETERFYYDKAGNHLFDPKNPAKLTPTNALLSIPSRKSTFAYDLLGRTIKITEPEKRMELAWNSRSQLRKAEVNGKKVRYLYDPDGRRVGKLFADGRKEFYGYDREDIVAVYDAVSLKNIVVHGPGIDEPVLAEEDQHKNYYVSDDLNSVNKAIDGDGRVLAHYSYSSFGKQKGTREERGLVVADFAYTGRNQDRETGLFFYRNRYLASDARKFISRDPAGHVFGFNLFAYVLNNPTNWIDPWGLYWEYSQSTGKLYYFNEKTKVLTYVATGYAGNPSGAGYNNPSMENEKNVGPIPKGTYTIGAPHDVDGKKYVLDLYQNMTLVSERSGFQIHGDNPCGCRSASTGCIILGKETRIQIAISGDNILKVTP